MTSVSQALKSRISANNFDTQHQLAKEEIEQLISLTTLSPSAFNLQNWKFIAVHTNEAKQTLLPIAYGQQKIMDAAVTFIVCGTLNQHETLANALKPSLEQDIINESTYEGWLGAAKSMYTDNSQLQRDEAIRSASLAAMSLMLAAEEAGLASCPMIGFDPDAISKAFIEDKHIIPVMLITVGKAKKENWPQKPRKAIKQILELV